MVLRGRGSDDTPQGPAIDVGHAFDGASADKSKAIFFDKQMGLP